MRAIRLTSFPLLVRHRLLLGLTLLTGLVVRIWGLDHHNIWWDEGLTSWIVRFPAGGILDWTARDVHPPLYFLLSRLWWLLVGDGAWGLRFLPVLAGVAAIALAYALGAELGGRRAGVLGALFVALSPFAVTWSQELRMYIFAALWATGALWAAVRYWRTRKLAALAAYILFSAAALWTLYLSVTILIIANLAFLVWLLKPDPRAGTGSVPRRALPWLAAQAAVLALFAPWLAYALPRMISWSSAEPFTAGLFVRLYAIVLATGVAEHIDPWLWPAVLVLLVFIGSVAVLLRSRRTAAQSAGLALLVLGVVLPALLILLLTTPTVRRFYVPRLAPRYFLPLAATFYLTLGWGISVLARRRWAVAVVAAGLVVAVSLAGLLAFLPGRTQTDQYASLFATLRAHQRAGEPVMLYPDDDWPLFASRYAGAWEKAPKQGDRAAQMRQIWDAAGGGLWVVQTPKAQEMDPDGLITTWLDGQARGSYRWDFGENTLLFYPATDERQSTAGDVVGAEAARVATGKRLGGVELLAAEPALRRYALGDTLHVALLWAAPPAENVLVRLGGVQGAEVALETPAPASGPPYRTLAHLPITPALAPGRHRLTLWDGRCEEIDLGDITVVAPKASTSAVQLEDVAVVSDVRLGDSLRLVGFDLNRETLSPGGVLELKLYWQAAGMVGTRYKVFAHLAGEVWNAEQGNFLWGQWDAEPCGNQCPTTTWTPGTIIEDRYRIPVSPGAPPGIYKVEVGMYGLADGVRLRVEDGAGGDAIVLGEVEVR